MKTLLKGLGALLLLTTALTSYGQDSTAVRTRPKVGLVLSGGGAKGAAHMEGHDFFF